ncbi:MAG: DUF3939 domain-containing protein [Ectobacillus sp.]
MFHFFKERKEEREITKDELELAVAKYLEDHKNVTYTILINDDYTVNYKMLNPYLPAVPTNTFLMTRETLEIFEDTEENRKLIREIDAVQRAIDQYVMDKETFPIIDGDENRKICAMKLLPYLKKQLEYDLYVSEKNYLVSSVPDRKNKRVI